MFCVNNTTEGADFDDVVDETEEAEDANSDENEEIIDVNNYVNDFVQSDHEGTPGAREWSGTK